MKRPIASLSLDLDNKWSYMKTHGDPGWEDFPSYLDVAVPRILDIFEQRDIKLTFFIVGQDAALEKNNDALGAIGAAGHEVGNHSFHHEPWLHLYSPEEVDSEIMSAEQHIERATGRQCFGFRGPGFSISPTVLKTLAARGYIYDASTFPTFLGPVARMYYFMTAHLDDSDKQQRKQLFGNFSDGLRPLRPHVWREEDASLIEIPVTTLPVVKAPIHLSYLLYLSKFSVPAAKMYFRLALGMCRLTGVEPSLLLHPLDFLGRQDDIGLEFFPAATMDTDRKLRFVSWAIDLLASKYQVVTMRQHAELAAERLGVKLPEAAEMTFG